MASDGEEGGNPLGDLPGMSDAISALSDAMGQGGGAAEAVSAAETLAAPMEKAEDFVKDIGGQMLGG